MKVLFTGSIYVGKTTTLDRLKSNSPPSIIYIPELARELMNSRPELVIVPGKPGILPGLGDYHFAEQARREKEAEGNGALHVVCDRGIVDLITHTRIFGGKERKEWIEWTKTYNRIYLFETAGIPFNEQGYPPGRNWQHFREQLDSETRRFLDEQQLVYFCLGGSIDSKESIIRRALEGNTYPPEQERRGIER